MDALVRCLELKSPELSRRVVAEMYEDPFWQERFGERGRRYAEQDGQYHVSYLVSALALSNPDILTGYARWLQSLLVSRGMCSRHIAENFERLARAIAIEVPDAEPAIAMLHAAREALRYDAGLARELQDRSEALVDAAAAHQDPPSIPRDHAVSLLAYLADAMALVPLCFLGVLQPLVGNSITLARQPGASPSRPTWRHRRSGWPHGWSK